MAPRELVTRGRLGRELAVNAATKPVAVAVGAVVAAAALLIGAAWLLVAAALLYLALALTTFFDADEAERVGRRARARARGRPALERPKVEGLTPELALYVERAREEERRVRAAIDELDVPYDELGIEIERLTSETERLAPRAELIAKYLREQRPDDTRRRLHELRGADERSPEARSARERTADALERQLRVYEALEGELDRFRVEMEHLIASLGVVRGELVRMTVAGEAAAQEGVAAQVRELRERVSIVAEGIGEAVGRLDRDAG